MGNFKNINGVQPVKRLMELTGIWPKQVPSFLYEFIGWSSVVLAGGFCVTTTVQVFRHLDDPETVFIGVFIGVVLAQWFFKYTFFYYNRRHFFAILKDLNNPIFDCHEKWDDYVIKNVGYGTLFRKMFMASTCVTLVASVVYSLLRLKPDNWNSLLFPFPLDMNHQPLIVYIVIFASQTLSAGMVGFNVPCFDSLICTVMGIAVGQLEILREKIIYAMKSSSFDSEELGKPNPEMLNLLKNCVAHHVAVGRLVKSIEETFTLVLMVQLFSSVLACCFSGINFIKTSSFISAEFARGLSLFAGEIIELAIFCVPGNAIIYHSERIRDVCYITEWDKCDPSIRKYLFIIMERSKRPFTLTAGRFVPLSYQTYLGVLKSAYSYVTVLMHFYSE